MIKLLYIHNTDYSVSTANLTQVVSMCNAFCHNTLETCLLMPINKSTTKDSLKQTLQTRYKIDQRLKIETFFNPTSRYRINKHLNFMILFKVLLKFKHHIVFTRSVSYLFVATIMGHKTIFESHNTRLHHGSPFYNWLLTKLVIWISRSDRFKLFISISHNLNRYWLKKGIPASKSVALHDGVDFERYKSIPVFQEIRNKLGLPIYKKVIVYTGNILPNRGIKHIIELAINRRDYLFYIVGGPNSNIQYYNNLYKDIDLGNIVFTGQVKHDESICYQLAADVLLAIWTKDVPTINYCSPLKIFEYMASGRPILASGYPTISEVIIDRQNGFLFEPDNFESLLCTFDEIITMHKKAQNMAENARQQVLLNYTWDKRVSNIVDKIL